MRCSQQNNAKRVYSYVVSTNNYNSAFSLFMADSTASAAPSTASSTSSNFCSMNDAIMFALILISSNLAGARVFFLRIEAKLGGISFSLEVRRKLTHRAASFSR